MGSTDDPSVLARQSYPDAGASADQLIAWYVVHTDLNPDELEEAIPKAIDALYAARDAGQTMHGAGAAAAVAALQAARTARNVQQAAFPR